MKIITEQEVQTIMQKAPQFTRDQVVAGLEEKGYMIQDVSEEPVKNQSGISIGGFNLGSVPKAIGTSIKGIFLGPVPVLQDVMAQNPRKSAEVLSQAGGLVAGSATQLLAKPFVSARAGITGDFRPVNVPIAGPVRPYESPLSPASQYIAKGRTLSPEEAAAAKTIGTQSLQEAFGTTIGTGLEATTLGAGKVVQQVLKRPLTAIAERIYQSALKPTVEAVEQGVVKTGLAERVWLTKGGVEKAAEKIDELESALGKAIEEGKAAAAKISTTGLREFVDPIRKWFETVDVAGSKAAQEYIDTTLKNFTKRYGKNIPIEEAQKLKVNTMRYLRNAYGELSTVQKETQKQVARFLKEGIVEKAPAVGEINARLKNLYALDQSLEKASRRIGNLNLLGLGAKIGAAAGGKTGVMFGLAADIMDKARIKSGAAIGINELSKLAGPGAMVPITALLNYVLGRGREKTK